jgi:hypothetical protein
MQDDSAESKPPAKKTARTRYRPIKACWTKERKYETFCHNYRVAQFSMMKAAEGSGLSYETIRRWRRDSPEFCQMLMESEAGVTDLAFEKTVQLIEEGDGAMIRHYQNARDPRFQKVVKHKHEGRIDHVHGRLLEGMTPEEKREEIRQLLGDEALKLLEPKQVFDVTEAEEAEVVDVERD